MFRLIRAGLPAAHVHCVTFVPFLPDGRCVLIERPGDGPAYNVPQLERSYLRGRTPQEGSGFAAPT